MFKKQIDRLQRHLCLLGLRAPSLMKGALLGNGVNAYWFRGISNFGDVLTPMLLRHYNHTPIYTLPHKARFVSVGSILEHLPENYSGCIMGSGFIYKDSQLSFPDAQVLSVRGRLSRDRLGLKHKTVGLGDPGLLASMLMPLREAKKYTLGIVPHHTETSSPVILKIATNYSSKILLINVQEQPMTVFHMIDQCEHILSSSLHGLIVADSLEIPNKWLLADNLTGGRFKFDDYYSSLNISAGNPFELNGRETLKELVVSTSMPPTNNIHSLKKSLHELWTNIN